MTPLQRARLNLMMIGGGTLAILLGLLVFVINPMLATYRTWEGESRGMEARLAQYESHYTNQPLHQLVRHARDASAGLDADWGALREELDTFKDGSPLGQSLPSTEEGRIDFKVALFNARTDLQKKAEANQVSIPLDLGMAETLATGERTESRLWQLASLVKLIDGCVDLRIPEIDHVRAAPPLTYRFEAEDELIFREFPVAIELQCDFNQSLAFLDHFMQPGRFFALRRFQLENTAPTNDFQLTLTATCSGLPLNIPITNLVEAVSQAPVTETTDSKSGVSVQSDLQIKSESMGEVSP